MAKMLSEQPDEAAPSSERRVYEALANLPDDWHVLHSVAWEALLDGRRRDGEADFVLVHPRGVVVLEVKGGRIAIRHGRWHSVDRHGQEHEIKNPFLQAAASKRAILGYVKTQDPHLPFLPAAHCVVFPDVADPGSLGPAAPAELAIGSQALRDPSRALDRLFAAAQPDLRPDVIERVIELLTPTVTVRPLLRDTVDSANQELLRLTTEQIRILDHLQRNPRVIIYGGAGTGKTVLAVERARRLAAASFTVLLTCFNRPLGDQLQEALDDEPRIRATSFHSFVAREAHAAGVRLPDVSDPAWDDAAADALAAAPQLNGTKFDALVIDEAQDFAPQWFTALQLLLADPDSGPLYAFADTQQAIYRPDWEPPFPGPSFDLSVNCRNTVQIATCVASIYGSPITTLGAKGPEPEHIAAETHDEENEALRTTLHRLIYDEKLQREQIIVLSTRKADIMRLRGKTFAGAALGEPGQSGCIGVETVHRFKGLEADAVILLLPECRSDHDRALAYIGLSRARAVLIVIGPAHDWPLDRQAAIGDQNN